MVLVGLGCFTPTTSAGTTPDLHLAYEISGLWVPFTGCAKRADLPPAQILRISQRNEPSTLDPHLATLPDEFFIIRALSEGLLAPSPEGGPPRPAAARQWEVSPDHRTYTFELHADARWSNGDPVTADDFAYSIRRALSPALAAPKAALFFPLQNAEAYYSGRLPDFAAVGVRALGPHRLELTLGEPMADFPAIVASGPWIPVHQATIEKFGRIDQRGTKWSHPGNFTGNGPFKLISWRPHQALVVRRNPEFRDAARLRLKEIHFLSLDNGDAEERAFRAGQVDVTMSVPSTKYAAYRAENPSALRTVPLHETRYLALNTARPPLDDHRVRRALALALDRAELTDKVLRGGQQPAFNFVPPGLGGYVPQEQIAEDRNEARSLLREAGYPGGEGFPHLELTTWGASPPVLEAIQQKWKRELGIEITLAQREARTHLAALQAGAYSIALVTAIPDYDGSSDLFADLKSGNPGNYPHWKNSEFDWLVAGAGRAGTAAARADGYHRAEKILLADMPLIPLYFNTQNFLVHPRVKNWQTDRLWTRFYEDVATE